MGGVRIERVSQFRAFDVDVLLSCSGCGHSWSMTSEELMAAVGRDTAVAAARRQMECAACGQAGLRFRALPRMRD
jgi:hypothetical protein